MPEVPPTVRKSSVSGASHELPRNARPLVKGTPITACYFVPLSHLRRKGQTRRHGCPRLHRSAWAPIEHLRWYASSFVAGPIGKANWTTVRNPCDPDGCIRLKQTARVAARPSRSLPGGLVRACLPRGSDLAQGEKGKHLVACTCFRAPRSFRKHHAAQNRLRPTRLVPVTQPTVSRSCARQTLRSIHK